MDNLTNERKIELLKIVLVNLKNDIHSRGICFHIMGLMVIVDAAETSKLQDWFIGQKPRKRVNYSFTKHRSFTNGVWWWVRGSEGKEQRILFLNHLIKTLT